MELVEVVRSRFDDGDEDDEEVVEEREEDGEEGLETKSTFLPISIERSGLNVGVGGMGR